VKWHFSNATLFVWIHVLVMVAMDDQLQIDYDTETKE
jgi:hypothetical protein